MASTLATPIAQAVISLFDGNLGKLLNYGYRPGYGILGATLIDWTPADLFLLGEQGAWYDPSDSTTLFADSAGTTAAVLEEPVGLMLDKSKGLVLGAELVTNGDFSNGTTGWTQVGGVMSSDNVRLRVTADGTSAGRAQQTITCVVGKSYELLYEKYKGTNTATNISIAISFGSLTGTVFTSSSAIEGAGRAVFVATQTTHYVLFHGTTVTNGLYSEFDNISVRELPGNHATQTTATKRPVLSAMVNLLTKTEQFDSVDWVKTQPTVTANAAVAPDGTTTADKLVEGSSLGGQNILQTNVPFAVGQSAFSIYAKSAERFKIALRESTSTGAAVLFDLNSGTVVATAGSPSPFGQIQNAGNGWYRCTMVLAQSTAANRTVRVIVASDAETSAVGANADRTGDGTSGIYIWGASLVPADQASLPYQRVNTSTDYDTVGFPHYLKFDGIDDALVTGSIDFTATDKMTVVAGVRKLSDAASAPVVELSVAPGSTNGAFGVMYPYYTAGALTGVGVVNRGTVKNDTYGSNNTAPYSAVATALTDISGSVFKGRLRVNGVQQNSNLNDLGTGNFGNYPLYIGSRAGTSLPFNGHIYSLIVRGAQSTDAQITSAETWVNSKTGAY